MKFKYITKVPYWNWLKEDLSQTILVVILSNIQCMEKSLELEFAMESQLVELKFILNFESEQV